MEKEKPASEKDTFPSLPVTFDLNGLISLGLMILVVSTLAMLIAKVLKRI
jgi:hypothetical protein